MQRNIFLVFAFCAVYGATVQSAEAQCQQCTDKEKCGRPHHTRIIVWRSNVVSGGLSPIMGGAPPQGFAVSSVPAVMVQQPAIAIHPASFSTSTFGSSGISNIDLERAADAAVRRSMSASGSAASTSASPTCQDPCGDILQLKQDVKDIKSSIEKITIALERHQQSLSK